MTHTLQLTLGAKALARSVLNLPEQFKSTSELIRAGHLAEMLNVTLPAEITEAELSESCEVVVTEAQRDLLKKSVGDNVAKLPIGKHSLTLLSTLGFTE